MTDDGDLRDETVATLARAGCVAAEEEAAELLAVTAGDLRRLAELVARRVEGEPLAWLTGSSRFCGEVVLVHSGVYVPRWQSEPLALEAARRLPERGTAVDLCCGSGAIARVLSGRRPGARVVAADIDPRAVANARANGLEAYQGDLTEALPASLLGVVDVVITVVPYVPTSALEFLPRDVLAYEPRRALDGGADGLRLLSRAVLEAVRFLRGGGSLLLELGGQEAELLEPQLVAQGYHELERLFDEEGDLRGVAGCH